LRVGTSWRRRLEGVWPRSRRGWRRRSERASGGIGGIGGGEREGTRGAERGGDGEGWKIGVETKGKEWRGGKWKGGEMER